MLETAGELLNMVLFGIFATQIRHDLRFGG